MSIDSFERYPLLFGPSPVHPLERLSAHLGGAAVWAKREDCNSGIACGGNKTRKLEYLVADALAHGCDTLVSIGGVQSNHTRQVAAVAARAGLRCVLIQESWVDWPDPVYDKVGNILLSRLAGADVRLVPAEFGIGFKQSWEQALRQTAQLIGAGRELADEEIELNENYHAGTYGIPDDATLEAMRLAARTEGMITDPVYEGKSMAGLIDLIGRGEIEATSTVLYAHLGGQPALNAYSALFR